jgi:alpha-L-glutamate ligase-like protein
MIQSLRNKINIFKQNLHGIMGINARNLEFVYTRNQRKHFPLVDNKITTKKILAQHNFNHVPLLHYVTAHHQVEQMIHKIESLQDFVLKPARGFGGGGIMVVYPGRVSPSGSIITMEQIQAQIQDILFGVYSIDNSTDEALLEPRITCSPVLSEVSYQGLPDIRVIVCDGAPVQAMLRLPTAQSEGRANLHSGGIGVGVHLHDGTTHYAQSLGRSISTHPDTGNSLLNITLPHWDYILHECRRLATVFPLGYFGVDYILDEHNTPMILELNARPGLEIQNANRQGLREAISQVFCEDCSEDVYA